MTMRLLAKRAAQTAALLLLVQAVDCRCDTGPGSSDPVLEKAAFGTLDDAGTPDLAPYLALVRAMAEKKELPETPAMPGRRAFVTAYRAHAPRTVGTATGESLRAAVTAAAESALSGPPPDRLELDVVTSIEPMVLDADIPATSATLGLSGYASTDGARFGFVLPEEIFYDRLFEPGKKMHVDKGKLASAIAARAGATTDVTLRLRGYRFTTQAVVESAGDPRRALAVRRGMPELSLEPAPDTLIEAVRLGADYLSRVMDANGKYVYMYHPLDQRPDSSYGMLRHCGTTYALLEAYEELPTPLYLDKAKLALGYLTKRLKWAADPSGQLAFVRDNDDEEQQKVGGAGLALIAFAKRAKVTGTQDDLETMRGLARLIVHQQYPDGHFRNNQDVEHEDAKAGPMKEEVFYYPGEAILGLVRLYAVDPDPRWLEAATKGADFCVEKRDAAKSEENQEHDQWVSYSLNELYRITKKESYAKHAFKIARAIDRKLHRGDAPAPDLVGSFYDDAQSTLTATRLEAYDADIQLARAEGTGEAPLLERGRDMARFLLAQQFGKDATYFLADPTKGLGGVRESVFVYDVRIDYVQHAMSAWLGFARILRDPRFGAP